MGSKQGPITGGSEERYGSLSRCRGALAAAHSRVSARADNAVHTLIRGYFTKISLLVHAIVYPTLMSIEGKDFHLFLDGISIEAVFVALMVGISTKNISEHQHHLHHFVRDFIHKQSEDE